MPKSSPTTKGNETPAVSVINVTLSYDELTVVENVSFEIPQGSITAIIGPNGSGKTTLLKAILGLLPRQSGEIKLFGKHLHDVRHMIGYVPQRFEFDREFPITVREFLDLSRRLRCPAQRQTNLLQEKITDVGLDLTILDKRLGQLSGGQLQRVLIAQAIINDPPLLLLDEPAANIDVAGTKSFYAVLEHLNQTHHATIVMVTHDISMIAHVVDTVICVNRRMLCYGSPKSALNERRIKEMFGEEHDLYEHHNHEELPHGDENDHENSHGRSRFRKKA